jgi:hypothetical protein
MPSFWTTFAFAALLTACGGKPQHTDTPASGSGGGGGGAIPAATSGAGMLVSVTSGDSACYVVINIAGQEKTMPGDFNLCPGGERDATTLAGKQVKFETKKGQVASASCQGDPTCKQMDTVDIVETVTAN